MKKYTLVIVASLLIFSCKKEQASITETAAADSSTVVETPPQAETTMTDENTVLKISNAAEMAKQVSAKDNDTLYVTNFFATWCGPCVREIPHFKKKMDETKGQPIKFTFVSIDNTTDWDTEVKSFVLDNGIAKETLLLDANKLDDSFFKNFEHWRGEAIPFTLFRKGAESEEVLGSVSEVELANKINAFKNL